MGMYTEVFVSTMIKDDPDVTRVFDYMIHGIEIPRLSIPMHPLFQTARWRIMLNCCSYYFVPRKLNLFEYDEIAKAWVLISRSDFKNYDGEAELFFDWLKSISDANEGDMLGYSRYKEDKEPTIYYK